MRFSSRTTAFARRVFPARSKLIHEPGCVRKVATPATRRNSRFAGGVPHLAGIFAGKSEKTTQTPRLLGVITFSSELRFTRTLYRWKVDFPSFTTVCRMTHFEHQNVPKTASKKPGQKTIQTQKSRKIRWRCHVTDKIATWRTHHATPCCVTQHDVA
jgi:hypothetical protein